MSRIGLAAAVFKTFKQLDQPGEIIQDNLQRLAQELYIQGHLAQLRWHVVSSPLLFCGLCVCAVPLNQAAVGMVVGPYGGGRWARS